MTQVPKSNGPGNVLSTLAMSGDKWVQLAIVVLVALSGGGNWLATNRGVGVAEDNSAGISRAIKQINEIHSVFDDAMKRQKEINADVKTSLQREEQHSVETLALLQRIEQKLNK